MTISIARHLAVLAITIASVMLFPVVTRTAADLHVAGWEIASHIGDYPAIREAQQPRGGEQVLPPKVQIMVAFLRNANAAAFMLSPGIAGNGPIMQRIVEGAFPIRAAETAPFYLMWHDEPVPAGFRVILAEGGVALAYRP